MKDGTVDKSKLSGIVITGDDFTDDESFELKGATIQYATLSDVGMTFADLSNTNWSHSTFENVDFTSSKFDSAKLTGCNISDTIFTWDLLHGADFTDATVSNVAFYVSHDYEGGLVCRFENATFQRVTIHNVFDDRMAAIQRHFSEQQLQEIVFVNTQQRRDFEEPDFDESEFEQPDSPLQPSVDRFPGDRTWQSGDRSTDIDCPSQGLAPSSDCTTKKKQWLVFHPDKNPGCMAQSTEKMKVLNNYCE